MSPTRWLSTLLLTLALLPPAAPARERWQGPNGVEIKTGMTKAEVLGLLGQPAWADTLDCDGASGPRRSAFYYLIDHPPLRDALSLVFHGIYLRDIQVRAVGGHPVNR